MKISKERLREIIKEELQRDLEEASEETVAIPKALLDRIYSAHENSKSPLDSERQQARQTMNQTVAELRKLQQANSKDSSSNSPFNGLAFAQSRE